MATTYNFSKQANNATLAFDPAVDVIHFDSPSISAASILINVEFPAMLYVIAQGKTVSLNYTVTSTAGVPITTSNFTFADGSQVLIGDNTISQTADADNNTLSGTIHNDLLAGLAGDDLLNGNDGDDLFLMHPGVIATHVHPPSASPHSHASYGHDTVDGGNGFDRIMFIEDPQESGVTVDLALGTASGGDDGGHGIVATVAFMSIEAITGTDLADVIQGNSSDNSFEGLGGNDLLSGRGGNDTIDGGADTDTAVYSGNRATYTIIAKTASVYTISGAEGTDTLTNVERLSFADGTLGFDTVSGSSGVMYRLYKAALDRVPDLPGLGHNIRLVDAGLTQAQMADAFVQSAEFTNTYGALSNAQFINQLYLNVLDRAPDTPGLDWNLNLLNTTLTRADMLSGFSESAENQLNVIGQIQDGIWFT